MKQASRSRVTRYVALFMVLAAHFALITALLMVRVPGRPGGSTAAPVQLMYIAPIDPPKVSINANLPRRGSKPSFMVEPPVVSGLDLPAAQAKGAASNGDGSGIDWAAEARRALQAFEIRSHQSADAKSVSGRPEDDHWLAGAHYAGEKFKTANGDWIVWLNTNCYEIASAASAAYAHISPLTDPVCREPIAPATP